MKIMETSWAEIGECIKRMLYAVYLTQWQNDRRTLLTEKRDQKLEVIRSLTQKLKTRKLETSELAEIETLRLMWDMGWKKKIRFTFPSDCVDREYYIDVIARRWAWKICILLDYTS
ncbi:hypothetical protein ABFX02_09G128001 [Erythranthe guttata]